jgi:hypothetical protein
LTGVDAGEPDEASGGTQNQPYTFTFVSHKGDGTLTPEEGKGSQLEWIESFDESWDVSVQEGPYSSIDGGTTNYKTYTISHSLQAQAVATGLETEMSYVKAKAWVEERLIDAPQTTTLQDERLATVELDIPAGYLTYNHIRQRSQSIASGSYNVTDTWVASKYPATHSADYSYSGDNTAEYNTVDVNVTAQGYDSKHPETDEDQDKYTNALLNWTTIKDAAIAAAPTFYALAGGPHYLRTVKRSESETHNKTDGSLTYSCTFDDATVNFPNAMSESLNVTYDNEDGANEIVVIVPVLAKPDGPVIQDMGTTNEKVVSVSFELVMERAHRSAKPDGLPTILAYLPAGGFRRTRSESWNPYSGSYNLSVDWVYV